MRQLLFVILLFVCSGIFAQPTVRENVAALDLALVQKDSGSLARILHEQLSYGHSNGWVESKREVVAHLFNGKLSYDKVESKVLSVEQAGNTAIVRTESNISYLLDGKKGELKLHVLQVWVTTKHGWQLLGRQGTKVN